MTTLQPFFTKQNGLFYDFMLVFFECYDFFSNFAF